MGKLPCQSRRAGYHQGWKQASGALLKRQERCIEKIRTVAGRIDSAFSALLMAQDMIDKIIPDAQDEQTRALAAQFIAKLIKAAIDQLVQTDGCDVEIQELPDNISRIFNAVSCSDGGEIIDTVDIDTQIERHLYHLMSGAA
ncbi:hypothetical protein [Novosphingobium sp. Chol11]|uniref:hypothetical protein n=1 Tax=Novosphingobium sp. Chol11 TaxID=1385763 RepID=UPI0025F1F3FD|nr:hypothetical protein [Novosphingobium sp. Chol11]